MKSEIVVGIDSSTTATKAIAWDYSGKNAAEGHSPIQLLSPLPYYYEQNPDDWWNSLVKSLQTLTHQVEKERIDAVAIANQRETFV
jgi:xylulokinase